MDGFRLEINAVEVTDLLVFFTTSCSEGEMLPANFESPAYLAVSMKTPAGNEEVFRWAVPSRRGIVPSTPDPLVKVMGSPSGGAPALERTEAVKVSSTSTAEGL